MKKQLRKFPRKRLRNNEKGIMLDLTGKASGRGAYVCNNPECFELARKARRFERSLSCKIPDEVYESMSRALKNGE